MLSGGSRPDGCLRELISTTTPRSAETQHLIEREATSVKPTDFI